MHHSMTRSVGKTAKTARHEQMLRQAHSLYLSGNSLGAEAACKRVLDETPSNAEALLMMGLIHFDARLYDEARTFLTKAIRKNPRDARAYGKLSELQRITNDGTSALRNIDRALRIQPNFPEFLRQRAELLADLGRKDEALASLRQAMVKHPGNAELLASFARIHRFKGDEPEYERLRAAAAETKLDRPRRFNLLQVLAKAEDDAGHYAAAVKTMAAARALIEPRFNMEAFRRDNARRRNFLTRDFFGRCAEIGNPSERPVLIFGMPRSGTSLVEQIIASHPRAFGAGEMPDLGLMIHDIDHFATTVERQHAVLARMTPQQAQELAVRYLRRLDALDSAAARVTDKMPHNFLNLGLIGLLFPNAKLIHCRRNPLDTCLSCFLSPLSRGHNYTQDLETLGQYYREYTALMDHWSDVFGERILHVVYEDLVRDLDSNARRIIGHIGLEWDERCLEFWKAERTVSTISREQVRQPVYNSSVGRWKRYGESLRPLIEALGPLAEENV